MHSLGLNQHKRLTRPNLDALNEIQPLWPGN
jgi:hypothetical protein